IEEPPADGGEVDHPAPVLTLAAVAAPASEPAPAADGKTAAGNSVGTPGWHAIGIVAALAAGIVGLVLGALAFARSRRTS
ncbi:MAG TPA: hypothetical protein VFY14_04715, partial [Streptomyces sp.]|nr:hypothetical protein [Streptomyces sp.]